MLKTATVLSALKNLAKVIGVAQEDYKNVDSITGVINDISKAVDNNSGNIVTKSGTPEDGQTLTWSASQNAWIPSTPSSGGGSSTSYVPLEFSYNSNDGAQFDSAQLDAVISAAQSDPYNTIIKQKEYGDSSEACTLARFISAEIRKDGVTMYNYAMTDFNDHTYRWMFLKNDATMCAIQITTATSLRLLVGTRSEDGTWTFSLKKSQDYSEGIE